MKKTLLTIIAGVGLTFANAQTTIFVSASATGNDDGTSWTDAYLSLNTALGASGTGDEIWVAQGTYTPGSTNTSKFIIPSNKVTKLYGGFTGNETTRDGNRNANLTILSGDANNDGIISTGDCIHVVSAIDCEEGTILDGFSITGGNAVLSGFPNNAAGGLFANNGYITVSNCKFINNHASWGGAMFPYQVKISIINTVFAHNKAVSSRGGAIESEGSATEVRIYNSLFYNNSAVGGGNAISTFSNQIVIKNSIIYGNNASGPLFYDDGMAHLIDHSIVQETYTGTGNINLDPLFSLSDSIDFTFSACSPAIDAGDTTGISDTLYTMYDIYNNNRISRNGIDIGPFEYNLNNTISINGSKLTAAAMGDSLTYQWINCSNNQPLTGKTSSSYTATATGNYAVILTDNNCIIDTSACMSITISGLNEKANNSFSIYPNPTTGAFTFNLANNEAIKNVAVYNVLGEEIVNTNNLTIDLSAFTTGVYFLKITLSNNTIISDRIIKK